MATNLVELLSEQFNDNAVDNLGTLLGETPAVVRKALTGVIPAVVGGVAHHIKDPAGAESVLTLLRTAPTATTPLTSSFGDAARTQTAYATGEPLLTRIFGTNTSDIATRIASYSGAGLTSVTSLLKLGAATLLDLLNQRTGTANQSAASLTTMMEGQADIVGNAMPAALAGVLGLIGIGVTGTTTTPVTHTAPVVAESAGTPWWRWLLILLGVLLLLWLLRTCLTDKKAATTVVATDTVTTMVNTDTMATATGPANPTVQVDVELPGGKRLQVAERSFNANLAEYLSRKPRAPFRTFTFDNLTFATNSAVIDAQAQTNVNDLIEIMKAYPSLVIKIEGHTDSTGPESLNETLSKERADAVKAALIKAGVADNRVSTQGFAAEKPTATNKTATGRQENRRIDVVIVNA